MMFRRGKLAYEWCGVKLPLQAMQSAAGWYLGTFDPDEGPCSRESVEYWDTQKEAEHALETGEWMQRDTP